MGSRDRKRYVELQSARGLFPSDSVAESKRVPGVYGTYHRLSGLRFPIVGVRKRSNRAEWNERNHYV